MRPNHISDILTLSEVSMIDQAVANQDIEALQQLIIPPRNTPSEEHEAYRTEFTHHALHSYLEQTKSLGSSVNLDFLNKLIFLDVEFNSLPKPIAGKPLNDNDIATLESAMSVPEKRIEDLISYFAMEKDFDMVLTLINHPQKFSFDDAEKTKEISKQIAIGLPKKYLGQRLESAIGMDKFQASNFDSDDQFKKGLREAIKAGKYPKVLSLVENVSKIISSPQREIAIKNRFMIAVKECQNLNNEYFANCLCRDYLEDHMTPKNDPVQASSKALSSNKKVVTFDLS